MNVLTDMRALLEAGTDEDVGGLDGIAIGPDAGQDVARRKVFYISGFDPLGPRRYRELYRSEGPRQAEVAGYDIEVEGKQRTEAGTYQWEVRHSCGAEEDDGAPRRTTTDVEFLGWDDIVRHSIRPSLIYVYRLMFRTLWSYASSGAIRSMWRLRSGPLIAGLVPAALMIFYLVYAGFIGLSAGLLAAGPLGLPLLAAIPLGLAAATAAMLGTRLFEDQMMIYFMVNDLGYSAREGGRYPQPLSERLDLFARRILQAVDSAEYDEVMVVGHSSGAQLAVTALARANRAGFDRNCRVSLMTLGQSIAMTSFLPEASELRSDLVALADNAHVFWLDVTAPGDGACFALTDPAANCREAGRPPSTLNPLVISAAFRETMDPVELARYRWRLLRMHFQYLCAFAKPRDFDYFAITAGPVSLARRFAGRTCSRSMDARPVAPIRDPG